MPSSREGESPVKAARNPCPLREFRFDPEMQVLGLVPPAASPFVMLSGELAAAVRRRRAQPRCWVQVHLGFLCEERRRETRRVRTKWQMGAQPGDWVWPNLEEAVQFMGALEAGQGQPVVLSTWAPGWAAHDGFLELDVGRPRAAMLPSLAWRLQLRGLPPGTLAREAGTPAVFWRLSIHRQRADTDIRSWTSQFA
jgi:hypothetical protein